MKAIDNKKGETLVETLMSLIIITLALLMLPGAIISAARLNKTVEEQPMYGGDGPATQYGLTEDEKLNISFYRTDISNEYTYKASVTRYGDEEKTKNFLYEFK